MPKTMKEVVKVGEDFEVTIPNDVLSKANIAYGDQIEIKLVDGKVVLHKSEEA